jgi:hypothetical protein
MMPDASRRCAVRSSSDGSARVSTTRARSTHRDAIPAKSVCAAGTAAASAGGANMISSTAAGRASGGASEDNVSSGADTRRGGPTISSSSSRFRFDGAAV